jgi:hypothetical protein
MAIDITNAVSGVATIKNGTLVVSCLQTGMFKTNNTYVVNTPTISDIESKYDNRFDDPSYYYGTGT